MKIVNLESEAVAYEGPLFPPARVIETGVLAEIGAEPVPAVPEAFPASAWSVSPGASSRQIALNIAALPDSGGMSIEAIQYNIGAGWIAISGTGIGVRTLAMENAGASYTFALRAVNSLGPGPASATKTVTSAAAPPVPVVAGTASGISNPQSTRGSVNAIPGTQAGDLLIVAIALGVNNTGILTPPGWTRVLNVPSTSPPSSDGAVYAKIATGSEPALYEFTWTSSTRFIISLLRITGAALPPHATATFQVGASGATATAPAITTGEDNALILDFVVLGQGLRTVAIASAMTEVFQGTNNNANTDRCTLAVAQRNLASRGTLPSRSYDVAPETTWAAGSLAIRGE